MTITLDEINFMHAISRLKEFDLYFKDPATHRRTKLYLLQAAFENLTLLCQLEASPDLIAAAKKASEICNDELNKLKPEAYA